MTLPRLLAITLGRGTQLACVAITLGLVFGVSALVTAGIAGIVALPALRVLIMLGAFVRARDPALAAIALAVLAILAVGLVLGGAG